MASTVLDELLIGLGFDYDQKDLDKFKKGVDDSINLAKKFVKAVTGMAVSLTALTVASTAASDEQGKLAFDIGSTVEEIDALQFANRRAGGSADGMAASLKTLAVRASEASRGLGAGVEALGLLGVDPNDANGKLKSTTKLFSEISDGLKRFEKGTQIEIAEKLGLGGSLRTLQLGSSEIKKLTDEARKFGVTTKEDAFISMQFQDSLVDIWQIMKQISRVLSRTLAPLLKKANNEIAEFWKNNRKLIEQDIPKYLKEASKWVKILGFAFGVLVGAKMIAGLFLFVKSIKAISIWSAIANASIAAIPTLIVLLVAAIGLLAIEANNFFKGTDNIFSRLIEKFPKMRDGIAQVAVFFKAAFETMSDLFDIFLAVFGDSDEAWEKLSVKFGKYQVFLDTARKTLQDIVNLIKKIAKGDVLEAVEEVRERFKKSIGLDKKSIDKGVEDIKSGKVLTNAVGFMGGLQSKSLHMSKEDIASMVRSANIQLESNKSGGSKTTVNNNVNITVKESKDPKATAEAVKNAFENKMTQATKDLKSPVDQ